MWEIIRKNKIKSAITLLLAAILCTAIYGSIFAILFLAAFIIFCNGVGIAVFIILAVFVTPALLCMIRDEDKQLWCVYTVAANCGFLVYAGKMFDEFGISFYKYLYAGAFVAFLLFLHIIRSVKNKPLYNTNNLCMYEVNRINYPVLFNVVEEMAIASGLNIVPKIYILDIDIPNSLACGLKPKNSAIILTKKLIEILSRDELQCVVAHEISHIVNRDTTYLLYSEAVYLIAKTINNVFKDKVESICAIPTISLIFIVIAFFGQVIYFIFSIFLSKNKEYLADACASQYTRYPKGLADALLKIESVIEDCIPIDNQVIASFFIVPINSSTSLLSTHPSTKNRIKILLNMKTADYIEYEKEFERINGKSLIPKNTIKNSKTLEIKQIDNAQQAGEILSVCAIGGLANNEQVQILKENKPVIEENIKKHREIEDIVHNLAGYIRINCECGTILKIPDVYKNTIVICPHCKKKHPVGIKVE